MQIVEWFGTAKLYHTKENKGTKICCFKSLVAYNIQYTLDDYKNSFQSCLVGRLSIV